MWQIAVPISLTCYKDPTGFGIAWQIGMRCWNSFRAENKRRPLISGLTMFITSVLPCPWARLPPDTVTRRKENIKPLRSPEGKPSHLKLPWFMPQYKYASHSSFPIQNTHKWQWHLVGLSHGQGGPSKLKGRSKSLERVVWAHRDELDALSLGHECTQPTYSVFLAIPRPERSKHRHLSLFY